MKRKMKRIIKSRERENLKMRIIGLLLLMDSSMISLVDSCLGATGRFSFVISLCALLSTLKSLIGFVALRPSADITFPIFLNLVVL